MDELKPDVSKPMEVVSACLARDLPVYRHTYRSLRRHLPEASVHVVTRRADFARFEDACQGVVLWDEDEMVPGMTLNGLKRHPLPFFPAGAGWYFQQFLKLAFVQSRPGDGHCLVWDADTILLRDLDWFDPEGRPYVTRASENHPPYLETFEALFGERPVRDFSYISQHQVMSKPLLRRMLAEIEERHPDAGGWAWAIVKNLRGEGTNLFSEYETYGHYAALRDSGGTAVRDLPWTRAGRRIAGFPPREAGLEVLARDHAFAAIEAQADFKHWLGHHLRRLLGWYR
jgi:hypothetical protein